MKKIKLFEYDCILFFLTQGFSLGVMISTYVKLVQTDSFLIPILGTFIGFIPLLIYIKNKDSNILELNVKAFGKIFGNIINIILTLFVLILAMSTFWNLINFIKTQYLYNTPKLFISILFSIPIVYLLTKDVTVLSRAVVIFFFIEITLFLLSFIGIGTSLNIDQILPIFQNNIPNIIKTSLIHVSYVTLPIFMLNIFSKDEIQNNNNLDKHIIYSYIISNIVIFIIVFCNLSVLGIDLIKIYKYPEFHILAKVTLGGFIQRVESILSIHFILNLFVFISFCFYYIKRSLLQIFNFKKKHNKILPCFIFIICFFTNNIFSNEETFNQFINMYIPISFILFFIIPLTSKKVVKLLYKQKHS